MNLDGLSSETHIEFDRSLIDDILVLDGRPIQGGGLDRTRLLLNRVRQLAGIKIYAHVESSNNFPAGTGIASSASGFAALAAAAACATGLELDEAGVSRLARRASGSACRSVPGGFVEWLAGNDDRDSYSVSIASVDYWELVDCIAILSLEHKAVSSSIGHELASTSSLQKARIEGSHLRLETCRQAIINRDFQTLADVAELDSNLMHAIMMTSSPRLIYWLPGTLEIIHAVISWRKEGWKVFYTIDAGANVHVICTAEEAEIIRNQLILLPGVMQVLTARPGGSAHCITNK